MEINYNQNLYMKKQAFKFIINYIENPFKTKFPFYYKLRTIISMKIFQKFPIIKGVSTTNYLNPF